MKKTFKGALLVGSLLAVSACTSSNPKSSAINFYRAATNGDSRTVDKMIYFGSAQEIKAHPNTLMVAEGKMNSAVKQMHATAMAKGGVSSIKVTGLTTTMVGTNKIANITVEIKYKNGDLHTETQRFIKKSNKWLLAVE